MADRVTISSGSPMESEIGFSRAARIGDVIAVAGTAPVADDGSAMCVGDVYGQTIRCLAISQAAIEQAGGELDSVIRTRIMLTDMSRWREAALAHSEFFKDIRPACTFYEVKSFIDPRWLVETEMDCVVQEKSR